MRFDRNLYAETWRILRILWPYALLAVLSEFAAEATLPFSTAYLGENADLINTLVVLLIWSLLLFKAHVEVLLPDRHERRVPPIRLLGFTVRLFGVYLVSLLLFVVPIIVIGSITDTAGDFGSIEAADPNTLDISGDPPSATVLLTFLIATLGVLSPFILFGTFLPAYVANSGRGFRRAFSRGRRQFSWMIGRLILGPGVVALFTVALYKIPPGAIGLNGNLTSAYDFSNPALSATTLTGLLCQTYAEIMIAILLSRAYLRDEAAFGEPTPGEDSSAAPVVS